jgi:hypothetical protein
VGRKGTRESEREGERDGASEREREQDRDRDRDRFIMVMRRRDDRPARALGQFADSVMYIYIYIYIYTYSRQGDDRPARALGQGRRPAVAGALLENAPAAEHYHLFFNSACGWSPQAGPSSRRPPMVTAMAQCVMAQCMMFGISCMVKSRV